MSELAEPTFGDPQVALLAAVLYRVPEGQVAAANSNAVLRRADLYLDWLKRQA